MVAHLEVMLTFTFKLMSLFRNDWSLLPNIGLFLLFLCFSLSRIWVKLVLETLLGPALALGQRPGPLT